MVTFPYEKKMSSYSSRKCPHTVQKSSVVCLASGLMVMGIESKRVAIK